MTITDNLHVLEKAGLIRLTGLRPDPAFVFRHALVQEAVYGTYVRSQRRKVHHVIAQVLESASETPGRPGTEPADLAYHFYEAGEWAKARQYARDAGQRSQAQYAHREASQHYSLALQAARQLGQRPPADLLRQRGQAYEVLGELEKAQDDFEAALDHSRAAGLWRDEWQLLLELGFLWSARDYSRTGDYYRQALKLAQSNTDDYVLAHSLNKLGNWHFNAGQNRAALEQHQEALTIFQRLQDKGGLAETYDLLGMVQTVTGQMRRARTSYEEAIKLFRERDDRMGLNSSLATLAEQGPSVYTDTSAFVAPRNEAIEHGRQALAIARQIGFRAGESYALCSIGNLLVSQGEYEAALPDVELALRIAVDIGHRQWQAFAMCTLGLACIDVLQLEEARRHLEPAFAIAQEIKSAIWIASATSLLALAVLEGGDVDAAAVLLDQHPAPGEAPSLQERVLECVRGHVALARGQTTTALEIAQRLIETTPELQPADVVPRLWHLHGCALTALGHLDEGAAILQAAIQTSMAQGTRPMTWRMRLDLARGFAAAGRPAAANAERAAARALVTELAASIPQTAWREHFRSKALARINGET